MVSRTCASPAGRIIKVAIPKVKLIYSLHLFNKLINFSTRVLNAFVALAECRQFTVAAERCHMSQPAFSQMITRLEAQAGTRLFERDTRNVSLTAEGLLLLPVAQRLLADMKAVQGELSDHANGRRGKVAIAALPSLSDEWLPGLVAAFRRRWPGVRVQLFDVATEPGLELLRQGIVDFALTARMPYPEEFEVRPLFSERFFLVCAPGHPLAGRKRVTAASLAGCDYIHSSRSGSVWPYLSPFFEDVALGDSGLEVMQFGTLAGLIASGLGVSVIPGFSLHQFVRRGLVAIPFTEKGLQRSLLMVKRRGHGLSTAAQMMLQMIEAKAPGYLTGGL
ncbi:Hydrogen peroxide-inducible protein activator [compost metagenome]